MTKERFAEKLTEIFPDKKQALDAHCADYGELLGHIFFADEINLPLINLLKENKDKAAIKKYCAFVEDMWCSGNDDVKNIVEITVLEYLSDEPDIWHRFGEYLSDEFKVDINETVLKENNMMSAVQKLN